jgi:hypothetical protein
MFAALKSIRLNLKLRLIGARPVTAGVPASGPDAPSRRPSLAGSAWARIHRYRFTSTIGLGREMLHKMIKKYRCVFKTDRTN